MVDAKKRTNQLVKREYTINLHKALHRCTFKKCAPRAVKAVRGCCRSRQCALRRRRGAVRSS